MGCDVADLRKSQGSTYNQTRCFAVCDEEVVAMADTAYGGPNTIITFMDLISTPRSSSAWYS